MAVTLYTTPTDYIRAYDTNTAYYTINSAQYAQINFSYVIDTYSGSTRLGRVKITPTNNGFGYYNPTGLINNILTSDIDIQTDTLQTCPNSIKEITLYFGEEYGDPIEFYTGTTDTKNYYNGCQTYENYNYSEGNKYWLIADGSTNGHILSPTQNFYLDSSEKLWIYFITTGSTAFDADYTFYDSNGASITAFTYNVSPTGGTMFNLGAGPANIPVGGYSLPTNWSYYTINFSNIGEDYFGSDLPTVYRKNKCADTDWSEVYWLNEHGGWSNFVFNKRKHTEHTIRRNTYDKFLNYGYSTDNTFTPQRQKTQFHTEIDDVITLNTEWINDDQNLLIRSLVFSPDVRVKQVVGGQDELIHYNIIDTTYKEYNQTDDGLYQYEIKMTPSHKRVIQRG